MPNLTSQRSSFAIKVVPGASRSEVAGWLGEVLKIKVTAAPEKGKANAAVKTLLSKELGLPLGAVTVVSGKTSARKTIAIIGMSYHEVLARLGLKSSVG